MGIPERYIGIVRAIGCIPKECDPFIVAGIDPRHSVLVSYLGQQISNVLTVRFERESVPPASRPWILFYVEPNSAILTSR